MAEYLTVLEPIPDVVQQAAEQHPPRLSSLKGKTVLLLDNRKTSAFELLAKVGGLLQSEYGVGEVLTVSKQPDYSRTITLEELGKNIGKAHFAITALGD